MNRLKQMSNVQSTVIDKNKTNNEFNRFDRILENDNYQTELKNDLHLNEMRFGLSSNDESDKKRKHDEIINMTPLTLVSLRKGKKNKKIFLQDKKVLLDSGSSHSMCSKRCAQNKNTWKERKTSFSTGGGVMKTTHEAKVAFSLSEFSNSKIIEWTFNLAERKDLGYDMIIGRDLLGQLGLIIDYKNKLIDWQGIKIPMRDYERLRELNLTSRELNTIIHNTTEPIVTERATKRLVKILDSNYHKANLTEIVAGATHLNKKQKSHLL